MCENNTTNLQQTILHVSQGTQTCVCITMQGKPPVAINYSASFCFRNWSAISVCPRFYGTKQPKSFGSHLNPTLKSIELWVH